MAFLKVAVVEASSLETVVSTVIPYDATCVSAFTVIMAVAMQWNRMVWQWNQRVRIIEFKRIGIVWRFIDNVGRWWVRLCCLLVSKACYFIS